MEISTLTTVYDADDTAHQRTAQGVLAREQRLAKDIDRLHGQSAAELKNHYQETSRAAEQSARERQQAAERAVRAELQRAREAAREIARAQDARAGAVQRLTSELPGGTALLRLTDIKNSVAEFKKASAETGESASTLSAVVEGLGGRSVIAAAAVGALAVATVAAGAGVFKLAHDAAEAGGQIHDLHKQTGASVALLSAFRLTAEQSNTSIQQFAQGLGFFNRLIGQANEGSKKATATLKAFGIEPQEALRDQQVALQKVFQTINELPNAHQKAMATQEAFGRGNAKLSDLVQEVGGDLNAFIETQRKSGRVMTEEQARAADAFGDELARLKFAISEVARTVGEDFVPGLTRGFSRVAELLEADAAAWGRWASAVKVAKEIAAVAAMPSVPGFDRLTRPGVAEMLRNNMRDVDVGGGVEIDPTTGRPINSADYQPYKRTRFFDDRSPAKGGGSGESAAKRAAQLAIESARANLREAESLFKTGNDVIKRALDLNLTDFAQYNSERIRLENQRYEALVASIDAESRAIRGITKYERERVQTFADVDALIGGAKPGSERHAGLVALKGLIQREQEAYREFQERKEQLAAEGEKRRYDIQKRFAEAAATLQEEANRTLELALEKSIEDGTETAVKALDRRLSAMADLAVSQGEVLRRELLRALGGEDSRAANALGDTIGDIINNAVNASSLETLEEDFKKVLAVAYSPEDAQRVLDGIRLFFERRNQELIQGNREARQALERDISTWRDYADAVTQIFDAVQAAEFQRREMQMAPLFDSNFNRGAAIEARRALEQAREEARAAIELDALRGRLIEERTQYLLTNDARRLDTINALNQQIEAEERLHQQRLIDIDREAAEERRQQLVELSHDIAGILTSGLEQFDGTWGSIWRGLLDEALSVIRQIGAELMKISLDNLLVPGGSRGSSAGGIIGFFSNALGSLFGGGASSGGLGSAFAGALPKFATGGEFTVGGTGSTDSQLVAFMATPGERVEVMPPGKRAGQSVTYNTYNLRMPDPKPRGYIQKRSRRELGESLMGFLKNRGV